MTGWGSRPKRHIKSRVMRRLIGNDIFSSVQGHLLTEEVGEANHYTNSISMLIECYVEVKLHAVAETYTMGILEILSATSYPN
mgnify:CR=1 FL=1